MFAGKLFHRLPTRGPLVKFARANQSALFVSLIRRTILTTLGSLSQDDSASFEVLNSDPALISYSPSISVIPPQSRIWVQRRIADSKDSSLKFLITAVYRVSHHLKI